MSIDEVDYFSFLKSTEDSQAERSIQTIKCNSCGSSTTVDSSKDNSLCPYCAEELIIGEILENSVIKPWGLVPAQISREKAKDIIKSRIKKKWFRPSALEPEQLLLDHFQGVYLPFWTFDCDMKMDYAGSRGDWVTDGENSRLVWTDTSGHIEYFFDDILVPASGKATKDFIRGLSPWDIQGLIPFDEEHMNGFVVEEYQLDVKEGLEEAKQKIFDGMELFIRTDIGGDEQEIFNVDADYSAITFKHVLLPVYTATYRFKRKSYPLVINGKNGDFYGKIPVSIPKVLAAIFAGIAVPLLLYVLFMG